MNLYDPEIPLLGTYPKRNENVSSHRNFSMNDYSNSSHNCPKLKTAQVSSDGEWINTSYISMQWNEMKWTDSTWVNLKCILPNKRSQTHMTTPCMIPFKCHFV
jgi:hypothetical protein